MGARAEPRSLLGAIWFLPAARDLAFLILIATLTGGVLLHAQNFFGPFWIDGIARDAVALHLYPGLNRFMMDVTALGAEIALLLMFCVLIVWSHLRRGVCWGRFFTAVMVGALALDNVVKPLVGRPRPAFDQLVEGRGYSWPSGHATATTALLIALAYLLTNDRRSFAGRAVWVAAFSGSAIMGISRIYLGVHWPTDVIAGIAMGATWTAMCARSQLIRAVSESHEPARMLWMARRRLVPLTVTFALLGFA